MAYWSVFIWFFKTNKFCTIQPTFNFNFVVLAQAGITLHERLRIGFFRPCGSYYGNGRWIRYENLDYISIKWTDSVYLGPCYVCVIEKIIHKEWRHQKSVKTQQIYFLSEHDETEI